MDNLLIVALLLFIYFLPTVIAVKRDHRSVNAIAVIDILFGWTLIGWLWAFIWSLTGNVEPDVAPAPKRIPCPQCAELILTAAKVCKHCGHSMTKESE